MGRTQIANEYDALIALDSGCECGTSDQVVSKVAAILGELPPLGEGRHFRGTVKQQSDHWTATLDTTYNGETFTRTVSVNSCEAAVEVVSLLIALAIDPVAVMASQDEGLQTSLDTLGKSDAAASTETEPTNVAETEDPPPPADDVEMPIEIKAENPGENTSEDEAVPVGRSRDVLVGIDFDADVGFVGPFRPGTAVFGAFAYRWLRGELSARFVPPQEKEITDGEGAQYTAHLFGFALGVGLQFEIRRVRLVPMVGVGVHGIFTESTGVAFPGKGHAWFASVWLGGAIEWIVNDWMGLRFFPALHWLPERPRFEIEGVGLVLQPYAVSGTFDLGVFYHF